MSNSPPNKLFDGQRGFPTPNAAPDESGCRVFSIPSDEEYFALFMAACLQLTHPYNWYKNGTLTQDEAAAFFANIIDQAYAVSLTGQCGETIPAPYWDTYADSDDQDDVLSQPWYGELVPTMALLPSDELTWRENVSIWLVAGFIAYAGQIGAAIAFVPFARQFVLKFRANPIGAVASIFLDGEVIALRDTYNPTEEIIEHTVVMTDDEEHTLWVAVNDESNPAAGDSPVLQVVRKELDGNEVYPTNVIYDPDTDKVKKDWGDGQGFVDFPQGDPRHSPVFLRPALVTDDPRCDSAADMVKWLHDFIDSAISTMEAFGFLASVTSLIFNDLSLISEGFTMFVGEVVELAGNLLSFGAVLVDESFTSTEYDLLQCIFFCRIGGDGGVTPEILTRIENDVTDQLNTTAALIVNALLSIQGEVGLANAGRIGGQTGDCSECACGWCASWDWTALEDLDGYSLDRGSYDAAYVGAFGDSNSKSSVIMSMTPAAPMHVTFIGMTYSGSFAGANGGVRINGYLGASHVISVNTTAGGSHLSLSWVGDEMIDYLQIDTNSGTDATESKIEASQIEGIDPRPDIGQVDCE